MSRPREATSVATSAVSLPGLEVRERARARGLALVAVDGRGADAGAVELLGKPVRAVLGAREDERLVPAALAVRAVLEKMDEQVPLVVLADAKRELRDTLHRAVRRRDLDLHGIDEDPRRERADVGRVGRGEHQVLPLRGQQLDDAADVVDEAHVEHAVGFVEHEMADFRQVREAAVREVEQASGRRHQDVAAGTQAVDLRLLADAAEDDAGAQLLVRAVDADALEDLRRELAGRGEHEHARPAAAGGVQQLQQGQDEGGGLAGPGLRASEQVAPGQHGRDRADLDGRGGRIAVGVQWPTAARARARDH